MLQRFPTVLAQVHAGNASENLLNKRRKILYFFYWAKEITKKVCNSKIEFNKFMKKNG